VKGGKFLAEIGEILKQAREEKNISLVEIEKKTKIRRFYIKSMEENNFDNIPGKVYAIGFLRTYADYLDLSTDELVEELKEKLKSSDTSIEDLKLSELEEKKINKKFNLNIKKIIISMLIIFLFVYVFIVVNNLNTNNLDISNNENNTSMETGSIEKQNETNNDIYINEDNIQNNAEDKIEGVNLEISALKNDKCWISVNVDGKFVYEGTISGNVLKKFSGEKEIKVRFGNPSGIKIIFNGEPYEKLKDLQNPKTELFVVN
jgi:cytoskeletal protein RodZ